VPCKAAYRREEKRKDKSRIMTFISFGKQNIFLKSGLIARRKGGEPCNEII